MQLGTRGAGEWKRYVGGEVTGLERHASPLLTIESIQRRMGPRSAGWDFRQPRHALLWFKSGFDRMRIVGDSSSMEVPLSSRRDLMLVPRGWHMAGEFTVGSAVEYIVAFIDLPGDMGTLHTGLPRPLLGFGDECIRRDLFRATTELPRGHMQQELYLDGLGMQLLSRLIDRAEHEGESDTDRGPAAYVGGLSPANARRVRQYIVDNLAGPLDVQGLAEVCGLSRRQFVRAYKQTTGMSPMQHVTQLRVARAKELLNHSRLSVTEVAYECGYAHPQHFTTRFKLQTGVTPSEHRRQADALSDDEDRTVPIGL